MLEIEGKSILFDPFITPNPLAKDVDVSTILPDFILISHGHGDHIADAVAIAQQAKSQVIATYEVCEWLNRKGVENFVPMNTGGRINLGFCTVKLVYAAHSSSMPDGSYGGNPVGFVITHKGGSFYYAGDTALSTEMKLIPEECKLDFAMLPIGDHFTMGITDAAKASKFIQCDKIIGMHFDTFPPIQINHDNAKAHFASLGLELTLPIINQTLEF
jgi:L-ascorbate metabolism protein UlaG (beta-lactamase superfamily)